MLETKPAAFSVQVERTGPRRGVISSAPAAFQPPLSEKSDRAESVTKTIWGFPSEQLERSGCITSIRNGWLEAAAGVSGAVGP